MRMKVFAISDLHLSTAVHKPMDVFGADWDNYFEKITTDWKEKVTDEDVETQAGVIQYKVLEIQRAS